MKTDDNILVLIVGVVAYVWGMVVFANYLLQSFWWISFQGTRMVEEGLDLFF